MKRIIVCIKCVKADIFLEHAERKTAINPYDVFSMYQASELKKQMNFEIVCLAMGKAEDRIAAELYKLGADSVLFLTDSSFIGADTLATSYVLSKAIKKIGHFDMIFCGDHAIDGETGHVAPALAQRLNTDIISKVKNIEITDGQVIVTTQDSEEVIEKYLVRDKLIICLKDYIAEEITLNIMQLKKVHTVKYTVWTAEILGINIEKCGQCGSKTRVCSVNSVRNKKKRESVLLYSEEDKDLMKLVNLLYGGV